MSGILVVVVVVYCVGIDKCTINGVSIFNGYIRASSENRSACRAL